MLGHDQQEDGLLSDALPRSSSSGILVSLGLEDGAFLYITVSCGNKEGGVDGGGGDGNGPEAVIVFLKKSSMARGFRWGRADIGEEGAEVEAFLLDEIGSCTGGTAVTADWESKSTLRNAGYCGLVTLKEFLIEWTPREI